MLDREGIMEHRQSSVSEVHDPHNGIFYPPLAQTLLRGTRDNVLNVVIQKKMQSVSIMNRHIQDNAATGFRTVQTPAWQMGAQVNPRKYPNPHRFPNSATF